VAMAAGMAAVYASLGLRPAMNQALGVAGKAAA
jgi:hypothetical protein